MACFAQQLSANRCYFASPGPFGSKASEVIRLFSGIFYIGIRKMQPSEKSLSAPGKPKASTHTNRCLFSARKSFALPRPPGGFFMFLSYFIRPRPKLAPSSASFAGMAAAPPPRGFFLTANSGKGECFYAIRFCKTKRTFAGLCAVRRAALF